jgi:riboflavin synthase
MFTGIVEENGQVHSIRPGAAAIELWVQARLCGRGVRAGDSLAVNGCCLTVEKTRAQGKEKLLKFALLKESWRRTNLQFARAGTGVNLERALRVGDRMGGHFLTGHIDGLGTITRWEQSGKDYLLEVAAPAEIMRYVVYKGSIPVDGISLTVAAVRGKRFQIWIIPHTRAVTALSERQVGEAVNLETDLLGKFVERFIIDQIGRGRACGSAGRFQPRARR